MKKLLTAASIAALSLGYANAIDLVSTLQNDGSTNNGDAAYALATNLAATTYEDFPISFTVDATGTFPNSEGIVTITLTGGTFSAQPTLTGGVISTGGQDGDTTVQFFVSDLATAAPLPLAGTVDLVEGTDLSVAVSVVTDGNVPVENSLADPATLGLIAFGSPFAVAVNADTTGTTEAALADPVPFLAFATGGGFNDLLGDVSIALGDIEDVDPVTAGDQTEVVNVDATGTDAALADITDVDLTVEGDFSAFVNADVATDGLQVTDGTGNPLLDETDIDGDVATATGLSAAAGTISFNLVPDNATPIQASEYAVAGSVNTDATFATDVAFSGDLQDVTREGAVVVFPWTASNTLAQASTQLTIIRIGNTSSNDTGAVFLTALNSSDDSYTNPGTQPATAGGVLIDSVPANGEVLITSEDLEAVLGDFQRADIEVVIESGAADLSLNRFISSPAGIFATPNGLGVNDIDG